MVIVGLWVVIRSIKIAGLRLPGSAIRRIPDQSPKRACGINLFRDLKFGPYFRRSIEQQYRCLSGLDCIRHEIEQFLPFTRYPLSIVRSDYPTQVF